MRQKKPRKIWNVYVNNIVILKFVKAKTNSKHLIWYLDKVIRRVVFVIPKISGYAKIFKIKDGDKDKNNKFMSFCLHDKRLLGKHKAIWNKIEDLKIIESNALPTSDDRYIKTKIRTYSNKHTNFWGLNAPEDDKGCKFLQSFLLIPYLYMKTNITYKHI